MNNLTPKITFIQTNKTEDEFLFNEVRFSYLGQPYILRVGFTKIPKEDLNANIVTDLLFIEETDVDEDDFYYYIPFIMLLRSHIVIEYYDQQKTFKKLFEAFLSYWPELDEICKQTQYFYY
mgnify:CR=1 FL=1